MNLPLRKLGFLPNNWEVNETFADITRRVNADQCVLSTLCDANFLGYDCILVKDCTATTSPEYCWLATLYNVKQCFGFVTDSAAIFTAINN